MPRLVPNDLREAADALEVPQWTTILRVIAPTTFCAIVTDVLLGRIYARIVGRRRRC
jgi:ABC-type phosphate transport system permease subunit